MYRVTLIFTKSNQGGTYPPYREQGILVTHWRSEEVIDFIKAHSHPYAEEISWFKDATHIDIDSLLKFEIEPV